MIRRPAGALPKVMAKAIMPLPRLAPRTIAIASSRLSSCVAASDMTSRMIATLECESQVTSAAIRIASIGSSASGRINTENISELRNGAETPTISFSDSNISPSPMAVRAKPRRLLESLLRKAATPIAIRAGDSQRISIEKT